MTDYVFALFFLFKMGYLMKTAEMYFYNDRLCICTFLPFQNGLLNENCRNVFL
jgi:hypothetical protein